MVYLFPVFFKFTDIVRIYSKSQKIARKPFNSAPAELLYSVF